MYKVNTPARTDAFALGRSGVCEFSQNLVNAQVVFVRIARFVGFKGRIEKNIALEPLVEQENMLVAAASPPYTLLTTFLKTVLLC